MKKKIKVLFTTLLMLFFIGSVSYADVIMPGESAKGHGAWRRNIKYEMTEELAIWKIILIGITIIAIVNVVVLIICKKMKNKKDNKQNDDNK